MNGQEWADALYEAWVSGSLKPAPAADIEGANIELAYQAQAAFISLCEPASDIAGFKGALTTKNAQKMFDASEAVSGVLLEEMRLDGDLPINIGGFNRGVIETEIGFRIGKPVTRPINSSELLGYVDYCLPMIELGDVGFERQPGLLDLVAGNAAASRFLAGSRSGIKSVNDVTVTLSRNGTVLHEASGRDAMGDQFEAAAWLVNRAVRQGYEIVPGQYLMTGSLGSIQPMEPGYYIADYGRFGDIEFEIEA